MSFLSKLFGKSKGKRAEVQLSEVPEKKPAPTGTTLRKQEGPELSALEIAEKKDWEVKSLSMWEPGDVILDTYEVEDVISGGMGHVYIANHNKWNVKLAIKSPNEMMLSQKDYFARILREANSWTELGLHPNIAYCYYVRNIEDVPHIVVEYVDGGNLRKWIEDGKCIDYRVNLDLAIQFCHGMEFAHSKGMIHRDIKPANVLMTRDGILKITDFGLVREQGTGVRGQVSAVRSEKEGRKPVDHGLTTVGTFMGTEGYIAPEQAKSAPDVDERADIFSFGVCLYEMFCGDKPYDITYGPRQEASNPIELSRDESFPVDIGEILKKTVQWNPSARYKNFKEIRQELTGVYFDLFDEQSMYAELELLDLEADGLNNRGVSYFDLGRKEDAVSCWKQALKINQIHLEATYNLSLIQWREAKIDDTEVLRRLDNCKENPVIDREVLAELTAYIHAERFDPDTARDLLKDLPGRYEDLFSDQEIDQMKDVRTMEGHTRLVRSVTITPDGRYAVSGSWDNTLRVWELETGQCLRTMEGHTHYVNSVSITPDGRFTVSGSEDNTLRVWDLATGRCIRTMKGHTKNVTSVAITPDGRFAVSGSNDNTLRVWELKTGQCVRTLEGHTHWVRSVSFHSDGRYAVSGSYDKTLRVWKIKTGQCVRTLEGHTEWVTSVAITPDGRYAVSGSGDQTLRVWELATGQSVCTLKGHTSRVNSVTITPDGRFAVSGSLDNTLRVWELATGRCMRTLEGHNRCVYSVIITPDGRFAVSGSEGKTLRVWKISLDKAYRAELEVSFPKGFKERKEEEDALIQAIRQAEILYKKGNYKDSFSALYEAWKDTGFSDKESIKGLYSDLMKKGRIKSLAFSFQKKMLKGHTKEVNAVSLTPDGRFAVSGSKDKTLRVWELKSGQCIHSMEGHTGWVNSVTITPNGRYAVSGSNDNTLRVWELKTTQCIRILKGHTSSVNSVTMTPDGRFAVSGSYDKTLRVWELETGRCVRTMEGHNRSVTSVSLTPDGRFAVSGSLDKTLRMWELETGQCLRTMEAYVHFVELVTLTPDGKFAVSGSLSILPVWELDTGQCIRIMKGHTAQVNSVAITPDGRFAVSGSNDNTLRVWELETGQCIRTMEGHNRSVTSVTLTPDGRFAVSGSNDKTLRVWELIWNLEFD